MNRTRRTRAAAAATSTSGAAAALSRAQRLGRAMPGLGQRTPQRPSGTRTPARSTTKATTASTPIGRSRSNTAPTYDENKEPVKVYLRVRPMNHVERGRQDDECLSIEAGSKAVLLRAPENFKRRGLDADGRYVFTHVFEPSDSQVDIFQNVGAPIVKSFLAGNNGLLFAYGNTGSGKTFTIEGDRAHMGVLPRIFDSLFNSLPARRAPNEAARLFTERDETTFEINPDYRYAVWVSYLEVYNDKVYDLLRDPTTTRQHASSSGGQPQLRLREDRGVVIVEGLKEELVTSSEQGHDLLQQGQRNRRVAETVLNKDSSRSHSIFTIKLVSVPRGYSKAEIESNPGLMRSCKLSVVDLAGSERAKRTGNGGDRLKEASNINTSLMTLGRCIETLRWNQMHPNSTQRIVPFRDSKLTRLFQDLFVGEGRVAMVVAATSSEEDYEETCHVLKFSSIAREVSVTPRVDSGRTPLSRRTPRRSAAGGAALDDLRAQLASSHSEVSRLRELLSKTETAMESLEEEIRGEVSTEMRTRLVQMEQQFESRLREEIALTEQKYERKMNIIKRMKAEHAAATSDSIPAADYDRLHNEYEALLEKYSQVTRALQRSNEEHSKALDAHRESSIAVRKDLLEKVASLRETVADLQAKLKAKDHESSSGPQSDNTQHGEQIDELSQQLAAERERNATLQTQFEALQSQYDMLVALSPSKRRAKLEGLEIASPIVKKGRRGRKDEKVLHAQSRTAVGAADANIRVVLPEQSKVVNETTKEQLMHKRSKKAKFAKYEVMNTEVSGDELTTTLFSGDVQRSKSKKGVNVVFKSVDTLVNTTADNYVGSPARNDGRRVLTPRPRTDRMATEHDDGDSNDGDETPVKSKKKTTKGGLFSSSRSSGDKSSKRKRKAAGTEQESKGKRFAAALATPQSAVKSAKGRARVTRSTRRANHSPVASSVNFFEDAPETRQSPAPRRTRSRRTKEARGSINFFNDAPETTKRTHTNNENSDGNSSGLGMRLRSR